MHFSKTLLAAVLSLAAGAAAFTESADEHALFARDALEELADLGGDGLHSRELAGLAAHVKRGLEDLYAHALVERGVQDRRPGVPKLRLGSTRTAQQHGGMGGEQMPLNNPPTPAGRGGSYFSRAQAQRSEQQHGTGTHSPSSSSGSSLFGTHHRRDLGDLDDLDAVLAARGVQDRRPGVPKLRLGSTRTAQQHGGMGGEQMPLNNRPTPAGHGGSFFTQNQAQRSEQQHGTGQHGAGGHGHSGSPSSSGSSLFGTHH